MTIVIQLRATTSDWPSFRAAVQSVIDAVRPFDGLVSVRVLRDLDRPDIVTVLEEWETIRDFRRAEAALMASEAQRARFLDDGRVIGAIERVIWEENPS